MEKLIVLLHSEISVVNRAAIRSVIETIVLCGELEFFLRGDDGNINTLVQFYIKIIHFNYRYSHLFV